MIYSPLWQMQSSRPFHFRVCEQPCCSAQMCAEVDDDDDGSADGGSANGVKRHAATGTWPTPEGTPPPPPCVGEVTSCMVLPPSMVHRDEASVNGRVTFRKYDNDSDARRRGTFERVSARQLWVGSCEMVAIVPRNSALHRTVGDVRPPGSLREQRLAKLRAVLGGAALGALLPVLQRAQIGSLAALKRLSLEQLQAVLSQAGGLSITAAERRRLTTLGLCADVVAPCEPVRMERV